eukprot:m.18889 g.18889  ORF g.18889 m.18889 type:complete len:95 (-) comp30530_c0_seq1:675-959(-)
MMFSEQLTSCSERIGLLSKDRLRGRLSPALVNRVPVIRKNTNAQADDDFVDELLKFTKLEELDGTMTIDPAMSDALRAEMANDHPDDDDEERAV